MISLMGATALLGATVPASAPAVAPSPLWYPTRGTGAVVLILFTASVVLGIAGTARWGSARWPRFVVGTLHRNISLLVLVLLGIHIVTAVTDTFAGIRWIDTLVPFISSYRPLWLGLGTLAFDLLIALAVTSALRQRLGYRSWKRVHWLAYASWPIAVAHGLGTGSDAKSGWLLVLTAVCTIAVVAAVWWRVAVGWPEHRPIRLAAVATSLLAPMAGVVWLAVGPLHSGWARRAGTPTSVLARVSPGAGGGAATSAANGPSSAGQPAGAPPGDGSASSSQAFPSRFTAQLRGTVSQSAPATVRWPGVIEVCVGTSVETAVQAAGGPTADVQAFLVGGYFGTWLPARLAWSTPLSQAGLARLGGLLGTGVVIVLPVDACGLVETARLVGYLAGESAGQCGPCVNGLGALAGAAAELARPGAHRQVEEQLRRWTAQVRGRGACHHPDGVANLVDSALSVSSAEIAGHARTGRCPAAGHRPVLVVPQ